MSSAFPALELIQQHFPLEGRLLSIESFGQGNIHDSFHLTCNAPSGVSYLLQRLNQHVFPCVPRLMENVSAVIGHLRAQWAVHSRLERRRHCLELIVTHDGGSYLTDANGDVYRLFVFINNSHSYLRVQSEEQAFRAASAFGEFQSRLSGLAPSAIGAAIPEFHNTRKRLQNLKKDVQENRKDRARFARPEIQFAFTREDLASRLLCLLETGVVPQRLAHNDAKLDNVLFCRTTGEVLCVCDLDTVMPGLSLYDFGDLVRSCASAEGEDYEAEVSPPLFEALVAGYLEATKGFLTSTEVDHLTTAGQLICFETGIRFLSDYLCGDLYFKIEYPEHNLHRARSQFALVLSLEQRFRELNGIVRKLSGQG